ncbi:hypothetical protein B0H11DRAFT_1981263 [Mycena galericulata]|nr:hypothetical protein B0H11DRAFT_1981263 [Mycena galericulata]
MKRPISSSHHSRPALVFPVLLLSLLLVSSRHVLLLFFSRRVFSRDNSSVEIGGAPMPSFSFSQNLSFRHRQSPAPNPRIHLRTRRREVCGGIEDRRQCRARGARGPRRRRLGLHRVGGFGTN